MFFYASNIYNIICTCHLLKKERTLRIKARPFQSAALSAANDKNETGRFNYGIQQLWLFIPVSPGIFAFLFYMPG